MVLHSDSCAYGELPLAVCDLSDIVEVARELREPGRPARSVNVAVMCDGAPHWLEVDEAESRPGMLVLRVADPVAA